MDGLTNVMDGWLLKLLLPDSRRIMASILMLTLIAAGRIQAYAFVDDVPGVEKPPFYDVLKPFDFWSPSMFLLLPLIALGSMAAIVTPGVSALATGGIGHLILASYVYLFSSLLFYSHDMWGAGRIPRKAVLVLYTVFCILLMPGVAYSTVKGDLELSVFMLSSILLNSVIFTLYAYIGICLLKPAAGYASRLGSAFSRLLSKL